MIGDTGLVEPKNRFTIRSSDTGLNHNGRFGLLMALLSDAIRLRVGSDKLHMAL